MKTTTPNSIIAPAALGETASSPTAENPAAPVLLHRGAVNMVWLTVRHGRVVVFVNKPPTEKVEGYRTHEEYWVAQSVAARGRRHERQRSLLLRSS